jgi:tetratricopeptide (TPR) repeat protein
MAPGRADRFDGDLTEVFGLQDRVAEAVAGAIAPTLEKAEIARALRKATEHLGAFDLYLRALASLYRWTRDGVDEAIGRFRRATELDPGFAAAYGLAARCYAWRMTNGWTDDAAREVAETARLARKAVELGDDDAVALSAAGFATARVLGDLRARADLVDRALALNPNLAPAWLYGGWVRVWLGEPEPAIEMFDMATRLSPVDPQSFSAATGVASAHFFAGRLEQAARWADKVLASQLRSAYAVWIAAASHALAGQAHEAQRAMALMREADSGLRIGDLRNRYPLRRPEDHARLVEGLRRAGVPECRRAGMPACRNQVTWPAARGPGRSTGRGRCGASCSRPSRRGSCGCWSSASTSGRRGSTSDSGPRGSPAWPATSTEGMRHDLGGLGRATEMLMLRHGQQVDTSKNLQDGNSAPSRFKGLQPARSHAGAVFRGVQVAKVPQVHLVSHGALIVRVYRAHLDSGLLHIFRMPLAFRKTTHPWEERRGPPPDHECRGACRRQPE